MPLSGVTVSVSLLLFVLFASVVFVEVVAGDVARREVVPTFYPDQAWTYHGTPRATDEKKFYLMLRTGKEEQLKEFARDVSNPNSPNWRKYMTHEELKEFVSPPKHVEQKVVKWLLDNGVQPSQIHSYGDALKVVTSVEHAERLLDTTFSLYQHLDEKKPIIRSTSGARIPSDVAEHVSYILGVSEFTLPISYGRHGVKRNVAPRANEPQITPAVLTSSYGIPSVVASQSSNKQAVAAFVDFYNDAALRQFEAAFSLLNASVTVAGPGSNCLPTCDQDESNLDVQYMTAMGQGAPTIFREYPSTDFTAEFAMDVAGGLPASETAYVYSISYGAPESGNEGYIANSEVQLAKLPALGITVFVSSGDDGALGAPRYAYNCPLDTSRYCPKGGCTHTSTQCGGFIFNNGTYSCFFPTGEANTISRITPGCFYFDYASSTLLNAYTQWKASLPGTCTVGVELDVANLAWFYSSCSCSALGGTFTGTFGTITPYSFDENNGSPLNTFYPASSEWVTSVGATQFIGSSAPYLESVANTYNSPYAFISSGGGFSILQSRPSWQDATISNYLATSTNLPPTSLFNTNGRAYPDITFNGHYYIIYDNPTGADGCTPSCNQTIVDGTSASSPAVAGIFSLLNDELISLGQSPLGQINQLLYDMASKDPSTFNDITDGDIKSNEAYPCTYGYVAEAGWDAASGLGSPNYAAIRTYILTTTSSSSSANKLPNWLNN